MTPLAQVLDKACKITRRDKSALKIDGIFVTDKNVANELAKTMGEISPAASYTA